MTLVSGFDSGANDYLVKPYAEIPAAPGLKIAVCYRAMEKVGGDYYDFATGGGKFGMLVADASGHGVPAALMVSIVKIAFWFQKQELASPDEVFAGMNRALFGNVGARRDRVAAAAIAERKGF